MEQLAQQASALMGTSAGLLLLIIGAIAGLIIGLLVAAFGWKRKDSGNAATVNDLQNELADYKGQVNEHFAKTSQLVGKLTDDYREVYRHLASGSAALCTVDDVDNRIGFDDSIQLADNRGKAESAVTGTNYNKVSGDANPGAAKVTSKADSKASVNEPATQGGKLAEDANDKLADAKTEKAETKAAGNKPAGASKTNEPVAASIPDKIEPKSGSAKPA